MIICTRHIYSDDRVRLAFEIRQEEIVSFMFCILYVDDINDVWFAFEIRQEETLTLILCILSVDDDGDDGVLVSF